MNANQLVNELLGITTLQQEQLDILGKKVLDLEKTINTMKRHKAQLTVFNGFKQGNIK